MKHSSSPASWHDFINDLLCQFPIHVCCDDMRDGTHRHRQFGLEFNLTRRGQGGIEIDGKHFPVQPDTLVIIPGELSHQTTCDTPGRYVRSVLCVAPPPVRMKLNSAGDAINLEAINPYLPALASLIAQPRFGTPSSIQLSEQEAADLHALWLRMTWQRDLQSSLWQQTLATLAMESMLRIAQLIERGRPAATRLTASTTLTENARLAHDVATHIRHHVADDLTAESLASHFDVSREHLSRTMKRHHGVSLHRYIMAQRVAAARRMLLQHAAMPILEVAMNCGFQSHAHFSRVFKQMHHMTPAACRGQLGQT